MAYDRVKKDEVNHLIGDGIQQDIRVQEMVKELRQRYHVFYLLPQAASYGGDPTILGFWRKLLGQNVLQLEDADAVCETIALAIGMTEGSIDLAAGIKDLQEFKATPGAIHTVSRALAALPGRGVARTTGGDLTALAGLGEPPRLPGKTTK